MNSRDVILERVRKAQPEPVELPAVPMFDEQLPPPRTTFWVSVAVPGLVTVIDSAVLAVLTT